MHFIFVSNGLIFSKSEHEAVVTNSKPTPETKRNLHANAS